MSGEFKIVVGKIRFVLLLPNVSPPVPFYSQSVRICLAWLRRVWSLVSLLLEDPIIIDKNTGY